MFDTMTHNNIWVTDQDKALDFYVTKLGLELCADQDLGFMRWLTVNVPGQPDRQIILTRSHRPRGSRSGRAGSPHAERGPDGHGLPHDCGLSRYAPEAQRHRVEFSREPTEQSYGIDFNATPEPSAS